MTLEDLISNWEPKFRDAFLLALRRIMDKIDIAQLIKLIEAGDLRGAIDMVDPSLVKFRPMSQVWAQAFEAGGDFVVDQIPARRLPDGKRLDILFDVRNQPAEAILRDFSAQRVTNIADGVRDAVQNFVADGLSKGLNPRSVALDIVGRIDPKTGKRSGGVLGLSSNQEAWSRAYADRLASNDPALLRAALDMKLRNRSFDRRILNAIKTGQPIPVDIRQSMVIAYRNNALKLRGQTIGLTEAMTALHMAQKESYQQAIDAQQVAEENVIKIWHSSEDIRVRQTHRHLDKQRRPFKAKFVSSSGAELDYPGDPNAPAEEIIDCRCWMETKINFAAGLKKVVQ